jgi:hypothetical protein
LHSAIEQRWLRPSAILRQMLPEIRIEIPVRKNAQIIG